MTLYEYMENFLRNVSPVPQAALQEFEKHVTVKTYRAGENFAEVGDDDDRVGIVLEGLFAPA